MTLSAALTLNGPQSQDFLCTLGLPCSVTLGGLALAASNRVRLLAAGEDCATAASAIVAGNAGLPNFRDQLRFERFKDCHNVESMYVIALALNDATLPPRVSLVRTF